MGLGLIYCRITYILQKFGYPNYIDNKGILVPLYNNVITLSGTGIKKSCIFKRKRLHIYI